MLCRLRITDHSDPLLEEQEKEMKEKYDSKAAEATNLKKENGDIKEKLRKKEAEIKQVEVRAQREDTGLGHLVPLAEKHS